MVFVFAFGLYIQVHPRSIAQRLKEMEEHFGGDISYLFPFKRNVPHQPRPSAKIQRHLAETIVHGQAETVPFYPSLVTQGPVERFAQGNGGILDGMVFIHVQIAPGAYGQINA